MPDTNVTFTRCNRVEKALESDPNIRRILGPKEQIVHKPPNNTPCKFSEEIILVTQAIQEAGLDVHTMTQREIKVRAMPLLCDRMRGKPAAKTVIKPEAPMQEAKVRTRQKAEPVEKVVRRRRKSVEQAITSALTASPVKPSEPVKPAAPPAETPLPEPKVPEIKETAKVTADLFVASSEKHSDAVADEMRTAPAGKLPYVWGVTLNTLLLSCMQLLEVYGLSRDPLYKRISDLSDEVNNLTVIPRPSNAKAA